MNFKIDNLQYCKWERSVFEINREANLDAVHVTVVYHEDFDEFKKRLCLLYTSPSPRDLSTSRMPSSA